MAYGIWAREIAVHWPHFEFADAGAVDLHRPLFYVLEGTLWALFGFHEPLGRLLSLAFGLLLAVSLAYAAYRLTPRRYALVGACVALTVLVAGYPFERHVISGLSDVPVAAMVGLTAVALVAARARPRLVPLVGVAACLAALTKPTALASLAGLAAAVLIGPRAGLGRRAHAAAAVAVGTVAALAYDAVEAHRLHLGLWTFLTTGTDGFYASLAASKRGHALLDESWLGGDLRLLLVFGVLYALARLAVRHRVAVALALPLALVWSTAGPYIAGGASGIVPGSGGRAQSLAVLVLAAAMLFALAAPAEAIAGRLELARLLVWLAPPLVVWLVYSVYDDRLLSAAWPPLLLLIVAALVPVVAGAAAVDVLAVVAPVGALFVLAAFGTIQLNGFGRDGWHRFTTGFGDREAMRNLALGGDFAAELAALEPQLPATRTIVTPDARLRFYYLEKVRLEGLTSCSQLQGTGTLLVVLESDGERAVYGDKATTAYWQACRNPTPTLVAERPGAFALFTTGRTSGRTGSCGFAPTPGLAVEFGRFTSSTKANALLAHAKALGFIQARVEQLGCSTYRLVETGVPNRAVAASIVAEAKTAHLCTRIVDLRR